MILEVTYMSGAGNVFSVIDLRKFPFSDEELSKLANILCKPNQFNGITTEGLLAMDSAQDGQSDFLVKFFNPDGTSGMMCGNGGRCAIRFAKKHGFTKKTDIKFRMADDFYYGTAGEIIDIFFPPPELIQPDLQVILEDKVFQGTFVVVGTEHFVVKLDFSRVEDFKNYKVNEFGRQIRHLADFAPRGTNVNFYSEFNGKLLLRTFERGVEAETGACGTGSIATVIAHSLNNKIKETTDVIPTSGLPLKVTLLKLDEEITSIILSGHAEVIGSQEISLPDNFLEFGFLV